ncbi:hypothetical protein F5Y03DRAFT_379455 [Xylaria venustula]|nr:hypothetical protein F5Y03DRAFT_379455 [Xylaria venustula]
MGSIDALADVGEHGSAILRVCSYHRRDFDLVMIRSRPHEMQSVQPSLQSPFQTSPTAALGILGRLPAELMFMILHELDIRSFFHFRQVNRQARNISNSLHEYELVSRHGLEGLRGLLRAQLAPFFTITDLYRALITTNRCSTCGGFGGHLFLFTVERCCFDCLLSSPDYRVVAPSTFAKLAKISPRRFDHPSAHKLRTVPGIYNMLKTPAKRPKYLVFQAKATQSLLAATVIGDDAVRRLGSHAGQPDQRFMAATAYPHYSLRNAKLEHGVSCKGCQIRHQALYGMFLTRDRVFSTHGFFSHFSQCEEAQRLWIESERGKRPVEEPQITLSCGYFSRLGPDGLPA